MTPKPNKPQTRVKKDRYKEILDQPLGNKNDAGTKYMAKNLARNLVYYAQLLKSYPLEIHDEWINL